MGCISFCNIKPTEPFYMPQNVEYIETALTFTYSSKETTQNGNN